MSPSISFALTQYGYIRNDAVQPFRVIGLNGLSQRVTPLAMCFTLAQVNTFINDNASNDDVLTFIVEERERVHHCSRLLFHQWRWTYDVSTSI